MSLGKQTSTTKSEEATRLPYTNIISTTTAPETGKRTHACICVTLNRQLHPLHQPSYPFSHADPSRPVSTSATGLHIQSIQSPALHAGPSHPPERRTGILYLHMQARKRSRGQANTLPPPTSPSQASPHFTSHRYSNTTATAYPTSPPPHA